MKLKPVRFAPQEDGKCICGFDPARIRPNDAGRFFCPQSGHEWEEDKPQGSELAKEAEAAAKDPDPAVCPECGGPKAPEEGVCRTCEEARAKQPD